MAAVDRDSLSVHWSAIFAGIFVTGLVYFTLMSLGLAVGAGPLKDVLASDQPLRSLGFGAGVWTVASVLISLFIGSYASGRVSGIIATRVGFTQGAVITALFMIFMFSQMGITALTGPNLVVRSPRVVSAVEDSLGGLIFRSPSDVVVAGLVARLYRGDIESAKSFLTYQVRISLVHAQARVNTINAKFKTVMNQVAQQNADTASLVGLFAFVTLMLGSIAAMLGGATGAMVNLRKPFDLVDQRVLRNRPA